MKSRFCLSAAVLMVMGALASPVAAQGSPVIATANGAGRLYVPSIDACSLFELTVVINADGSACGDFVCHIPGPDGSALIGTVSDGAVNEGGSVTFSGVCCFVLPGGGIVPDLDYEVTAYPGGAGAGWRRAGRPGQSRSRAWRLGPRRKQPRQSMDP